MIGRLQYITQDIESVSHEQLVKEACDAGIEWIQLRVKEKTQDEWMKIAYEVKKVCDTYKATLIINDNVQITKEVDAHGVHLGKSDMSAKQARAILGKDFIIGATANNFNDIKTLSAESIDYIGPGPFRFTSTKKNLSPVIGLNGYENIISKCKAEGINIPIIAIGGITAKDVISIMDIGVYGIAVSSYISNAKNKKDVIGQLIQYVEKKNKNNLCTSV